VVSRLDGSVLLAIFFGWLAAVVREAHRQRSAAEQVLAPDRPWRALVCCAVGLGLLIGAGRFIVSGAVGIAAAWGLDTFLVGVLLVAIGTSVPELATTLIAKLRGHDEVGLGTILGSNIFNSLWIVGVVAVLCPIVVPFHEIALTLAVGVVTVALVYPTRGGMIGRGRGFLLLAFYVAYVVATLEPGSHR
jgi:cation:H+ antiporter